MRFQRMSASSKELVSASWTGIRIRGGSHIDKALLTFRDEGIGTIGVQVRKGLQDVKADDPQ